MEKVVDPLPVELTSFVAEVIDNSIYLSWETATEVNDYGFNIERLKDNNDWETVGFVQGAGNSNSPKGYSFVDSKVTSAQSYFID